MKSFDLIIVGGGMVGLSAAVGAAKLGYQVAVVDQTPEPEFHEAISNRVSALNPASVHFLMTLGVWPRVLAKRATPFSWMRVWQADHGGDVTLNGNELGVSALGHIVENQVIAHSLYQQAAQHSNLALYFSAATQQLNLGEREAWLTLADGRMLGAQLILAADGGQSWCRQQAHLPLSFRDYGHHALVATVRTERPHEQCARQAFTSLGPLAFLPLHDRHLCSIVWSIPPEQAVDYEALDPEALARKVTAAFDSQLGLCQLVGPVSRIPLTLRYARQWLKPRLLLLGDAAHTIHPLAGQGVNLGFADAEAVVANLAAMQKNTVTDLGDATFWRPYERARKTAALEMIAAMDAIQWAFSAQPAPFKILMGLGMNLVNQATPVKQLLMKRAMGL